LQKNLVILKIKDGGGGHLENRKIAISLATNPQITPIFTFAFHIFVVSKHRDFIFGLHVDNI